MSRISQILLQTTIGIIIGTALWLVITFVIVSLLSYNSDRIGADIFGATSIDGKLIILLGSVAGLIQGFLIGLVSGYLGITSLIKGAITGVIVTTALQFLLLILSNLRLVIGRKDLVYKLETLISDVPGFVFLAILLAVPSIILSIAIVKASAFVTSSLNLNK